MTDETRQPQSNDDRPKRRRRRRRPRADGDKANTRSERAESTANGPAANAPAKTDTQPQADGGEKRKRRRRRRKKDDGTASPRESRGPSRERATAPAADSSKARSQGRPKRSRRSERDDDDNKYKTTEAATPAREDFLHKHDELDDDDDDDPAPSIVYGDDDDDTPAPALSLAPLFPRRPHDEPDLATSEWDENGHTGTENTANVVGIKFVNAGKIYHYDAGNLRCTRDQRVVVDAERSTRIGTVAVSSRRMPYTGKLRKVIRFAKAPTVDDDVARSSDEENRTVLTKARAIARGLKLEVKIFRADITPSGKRIRIYYTSENRLELREFIRQATRELGGRVELRQTGVRDQAKMVGGIGSCGQELCCTTWLPEFVPVSIKAAKDQGLVLNPTKVSGQCGRLKCCLVYEQQTYAELRKGMPKLGKRVITEIGEGRVVEVDVLRQRIRVSHENGDSKIFTKDEVQPKFPSQQPTAKSDKPKRSRRRRRGGDDSDDGGRNAAPRGDNESPPKEASAADEATKVADNPADQPSKTAPSTEAGEPGSDGSKTE